MKLGRVQSKHDPRTLLLTNYLATHAMPAPPVRELLGETGAWPMLANDRFNCCTSAAAGHMVHHWTAANHKAVLLNDEDIIRAHAKLTNDRLMDSVSMLDALKFWRCTGIGDHRIEAFVKAEAGHAAQLRTIVHLFGSAYVGLDLPQFACTGDPQRWPDIPWAVPVSVAAADMQQRPENGHCVTAVGYDADGVYVVTWGRLKAMSWDFYTRYNVEAYAVLSSDWVRRHQASPTGFDFESLQNDLAFL